MRRTTALIALVAAGCSQQSGAPEIRVDDAWARASMPGKTVTTAYFAISNRGAADDALIGVSSSTGPAEIHSTSMAGGIMRMRQLDRLAVPAGATVKLEPGGTHLMLTQLRAPLAPGDKIELSLRFEKSAERKVAADIHDASGGQM